MATCPRGHDSVADDYCDDCGRPMSREPRVEEAFVEQCRVCRTPRAGDGRYCEACGNPFQSETPTDDAGEWSVVVTADAEYFARVMALDGPDASTIRFPPFHEPWTVVLRGDHMRVGRRHSRDTPRNTPEIDMTGPPTDVGISYAHALLVRQPDGTWTIVDRGSANGTTMNGRLDPIAVNLAVPLSHGDRIHMGAWTTLEVRMPRRP